jgi:hypothetical protein
MDLSDADRRDDMSFFTQRLNSAPSKEASSTMMAMSVLMLSIIAVNVINYLNNMLGRLLGPAEYSAYAALMALFLIVNSARFTASQPETQPQVLALALTSSLFVVLACVKTRMAS